VSRQGTVNPRSARIVRWVAIIEMTMPSSLVPRVAARHVRRADLVQRDAPEKPEVVLKHVPHTPNLEVNLSEGGTMTDLDVRRLLHQRKSPVALSSLWFCLSLTTAGMNEVLWEGIADSGETVSGRLVLHAGVEPDHVTLWSEIVLDPSEDEQLGVTLVRGACPLRTPRGGSRRSRAWPEGSSAISANTGSPCTRP
jgi:hypothetical protein